MFSSKKESPGFCFTPRDIHRNLFLRQRLVEEFLEFFLKGIPLLIALFGHDLAHILDRLLLLVVQLGRHFEIDLDVQIALSLSLEIFYALILETEGRTRLCACRYLIGNLALQCRYDNLCTEGCLVLPT